jgi:collagenase-like PrtC family protease
VCQTICDVACVLQDLGVVSLLRRVAPSLPVHGSTQMTITSPEGAQFAAGGWAHPAVRAAASGVGMCEGGRGAASCMTVF